MFKVQCSRSRLRVIALRGPWRGRIGHTNKDSTRSNEVSPKDDEFRSGTNGGDDLSISDLIYKVSDSRRIYYLKAFFKKLIKKENLSNGHALSILDGTPFLVVARATVDLAGEVNTGIHDAGRMRGGAQTGVSYLCFLSFI
jgi:hypothetical protein